MLILTDHLNPTYPASSRITRAALPRALARSVLVMAAIASPLTASSKYLHLPKVLPCLLEDFLDLGVVRLNSGPARVRQVVEQVGGHVDILSGPCVGAGEHTGEELVRQEADVLGEHAEDEPVDEVGDRLRVVPAGAEMRANGCGYGGGDWRARG